MTRPATRIGRGGTGSRGRRLHAGLAAACIAAAFTLPSLAPASADDGPVFKKRRDKDITIIVIDDDDRNRKRFVREENRKPPAQRSIERPDDDLVIKLPRRHRDHGGHDGDRHRRTSGTRDGVNEERFWGNDSASGAGHGRSGRHDGPKVIIVDRNTSACEGSGVCVIRP
ncbi:MAG: hypothetical protein RIC18_06005 [Hoeflea sp.]|uniref:hypothetical protein n=1 Tax=Hoeflea sp. TaxID=1940281 RepID=UPI0032ECD178